MDLLTAAVNYAHLVNLGRELGQRIEAIRIGENGKELWSAPHSGHVSDLR